MLKRNEFIEKQFMKIIHKLLFNLYFRLELRK